MHETCEECDELHAEILRSGFSTHYTPMTFSQALERCVKERAKILREGWMRKQIFIVFQAGYPDGIAINKNTAEATGVPEGTMMKFSPYLMLVDANGMNCPWTPYTVDILAEDWQVKD